MIKLVKYQEQIKNSDLMDYDSKRPIGEKMDVSFLNLTIQDEEIKPKINEVITETIDSGYYILGPQTEKFEKAFAKFNEVKHCVAVGSGTDALYLIMKAIGIKPGDEVITVPNTAVPTANAIWMAGAKPVFVDVDKYFLLNLELLPQYINDKTKAILPVHLYGNCVNIPKLQSIAKDIPIIEDTAQAAGAKLLGKFAGTMGLAGAFSFYPTKNLGGYGDGGAILTNSDSLAKKIRMLRNHGQTKKYYHKYLAGNSRMSELQAAILNIKLEKLEEWNNERRRLAVLYDYNLRKESHVVLPESSPHCEHSYHLYIMKSSDRDNLIDFLTEQGVGTMIHYPVPIHLQEAFSYLGHKQGDFPKAEKYSAQILSLPMYPGLKRQKVDYVCDCIKRYNSVFY